MKKLAILVALALVGGMIAGRGEVQAVSFTVNSTADAPDANPGDGVCATAVGACTLRAAIQEANALPGPDTIFVPAGTYNLSLGELSIADSLEIRGGSAASTIIDAGGNSRAFVIAGSITVDMDRLTIRNGNHAFGGGIYSEGNLTITNSAISGNTAANQDGGGILNVRGGLTIRNTTISGNTASRAGGGIANFGGTVTISNTTISGNTVVWNVGGGIYNASYWLTGTGGVLTVTGSIISGNTAPLSGSAIYNVAAAPVALRFNNIVGNAGTSLRNANDLAMVNAENNWWGCTGGPGSPGCDTVGGNVDFAPWLGLPVTDTLRAWGDGTNTLAVDAGGSPFALVYFDGTNYQVCSGDRALVRGTFLITFDRCNEDPRDLVLGWGRLDERISVTLWDRIGPGPRDRVLRRFTLPPIWPD